MVRSDGEFTNMFKAARRVSTPLVAVRTPDPALTVERITETTMLPESPDSADRLGCTAGLLGPE